MSDRALSLLALGAALALLGLNVAFKDVPDRKDAEAHAQRLMQQNQWVGRLAPDFELPASNGSSVSLADVVGKKIVVVNFWATWCGPCRQEMPELARWAEKASRHPVLLVGIDVSERPEIVAAFLKEHPVSYPVAFDVTGAVARAYGVSSYPTTVVVGPDGRVLLYEVGAILNADVSLGEAVDKGVEGLRKGRTVTRDAYLAKLHEELKSMPPPRSPAERREPAHP